MWFRAIGIDSRIHKVLTVEASVAARKSYGGTAPENVAMRRSIGKAPRRRKSDTAP